MFCNMEETCMNTLKTFKNASPEVKRNILRRIIQPLSLRAPRSRDFCASEQPSRMGLRDAVAVFAPHCHRVRSEAISGNDFSRHIPSAPPFPSQYTEGVHPSSALWRNPA
jgi:hypothetical protein